MKNTKHRKKQNWKRQIGYQVKQWRKQNPKQTKKQNQKDYFERVYDDLKTVEFKAPKELSMTKRFYMPKIDHSFHFGSNALAIYPVLCGRADFYNDTKWVRISRENIGKLSGIWEGAVDKGISKLLEMKMNIRNPNTNELQYSTSLLQRREWKDGKRRGYEYLPGFFRYDIKGLDPHQWRGQYFSFHTCIVDSGIWAELSRKAKALYLAMRSKSFFEQQAYLHIENVWIPTIKEIYDEEQVTPEQEKRKFSSRKWDVCNRPLKELFELTGLPYRNTRQLIDELARQGLVERVHETKSVFKIFLQPEPLLKNAIKQE